MAAQVVSLFQRPAPVRDWSQQELAEFYRVENALLQAGMRIETDRGVTDDGEPWFAFCRADDGEVFIHFARIGGQYIIAGPAYEGIAKGWDFAALVRDLISRHPLVSPAGPPRKSNIFMHPAALLIAVVGTAFFKTSEAKADDGSGEGETSSHRRLTLTKAIGVAVSGQAAASIPVDAHQTLTLVASAMANLDRASKTPIAEDSRTLGERLKSEAAFDATWAGASRQLAAPAAPSAAGAEKLTSHLAVLPSEASSWLSLAVVLADLAPSSDGGVAPPADTVIGSMLETASAAAPVESSGAPLPAVTPSVLLVDLTSDALPDVMAVRLLRAVDASLGLQTKVILLDELPAYLAPFFERAQHLSAVEDAPAPPPTAVEPALADSGLLDVTTPLDTSLIPSPHDAPTPVDTPPAPEMAVPPTPAEHDNAATFAAIFAAIAHFDRATPDHEVVNAGRDIIVYDTRVRYGLLPADQVETVVYHFDEGYSLTLIGKADAVFDDWAFG